MVELLRDASHECRLPCAETLTVQFFFWQLQWLHFPFSRHDSGKLFKKLTYCMHIWVMWDVLPRQPLSIIWFTPQIQRWSWHQVTTGGGTQRRSPTRGSHHMPSPRALTGSGYQERVLTAGRQMPTPRHDSFFLPSFTRGLQNSLLCSILCMAFISLVPAIN